MCRTCSNSHPWRHERIRLAYLCGEFRQQATSLLMIDLFERHDRQRFELYAFDLGWSDGSEIRKRIDAAFHEVVDLSGVDDAQAAAEIRKREIDIVVDLNGYFGQARPGILARRPCPVQVNYLGFPGTLGASHMDYMLADVTVIPPADQGCYDECITYLPDTYQANDSTRTVAEPSGTRADAGLPDGAFVFCCFNNNFKITPAVFAVWMRLLTLVKGSVLWLLKDNDDAAASLQQEARQHGVAPERLVFAPRVPLEQHLTRHRFAHLFLDTLPCNAHTTASDALWAGLPLLTCLGTTFSGRVAASLLKAVGLSELVAPDLAAYEGLALELANSPQRLDYLRGRLERHKASSPLFDTARMARHVDAAFVGMWERNQRGEAPQSFTVVPIES
jgi:predicted O-linked N-acetylglucosamine transferase (SPINDLY family)